MRGPVLTFATRDQHRAAVRQLMRERDLDCLLVGGFRARERYDTFLTDDYVEGSVVFPPHGEPAALTWTNMRVLRALDSAERGHELWVQDMPNDLGVRYVGSASEVRPVRNVPLQRGMVLALEPNACLGDHRVNIGGTVIVTEHGVEELNEIPTRLIHK